MRPYAPLPYRHILILRDTLASLVIGLMIVLAPPALTAQTLSFADAMSRAMEHNYDIRTSMIDVEVAANNAERSANGYLPSVRGTGGYTWTYFTSNNELRDRSQSFDPNSSYNYSAGLTATYSIFDGFGRKMTYAQSVGQARLSELQMKRLAETVLLDLSTLYHQVAQLEQQSASLDSSLTISQQRRLRASYAYDSGQGNRLELLNAQVDVDNDSIAWLESRQLLANSRRSLGLLIGLPADTTFVVDHEVQLRADLQPEVVVASAMANNSLVLSAAQSQQIAEMAVAAQKGRWYPSIGATAGYQYRGINDPNGAFLLSQESFGPTAGLDLSWTLFDGRERTDLQNARLQQERSTIALEQQEAQIEVNALNTLGRYQNALTVLDARGAAVTTAELNFERSEESFAQGQIASVEFRQAQLNLLNARLQLSEALYAAKQLEVEVTVLMGE